jgi:hypothetical protein
MCPDDSAFSAAYKSADDTAIGTTFESAPEHTDWTAVDAANAYSYDATVITSVESTLHDSVTATYLGTDLPAQHCSQFTAEWHTVIATDIPSVGATILCAIYATFNATLQSTIWPTIWPTIW